MIADRLYLFLGSGNFLVTWSNSFPGHLTLEPDDVGNARVCGRHDAQWQEVLCQHDGKGVPVTPTN